MVKREYSDNSTQNARIKINYTGAKPKVTFSYPNKKQQMSGGSSYDTIWWFVLMIYLIALYLGVTINDSVRARTIHALPEKEAAYTECSLYVHEHTDELAQNGCTLYALNKSVIKYNLFVPGYTDMTLMDGEIVNSKAHLYRGGILFITPWIISFIIWFPFRKFWNKRYPKLQAGFRSKRVAIFKPKDIIHQDGKMFFEIPLYSNVRLDYEATEEYSKYLTLFEVVEHPFVKRVRYIKGKRRLRVNEFLWRARFYYSQEPQKGKLEVYFK